MVTVKELLEFCKEQIKEGNGDKIIMISSDDEGNDFHYLIYGFTPIEGYEDYINERVSNESNTIILG